MYGRSRSTYRRYFCSALLALACAFPLVASGVQAQNVLTFSAVNHNFGSTAVNTTVTFGMKVTNSSTTTAYLNFQINISGTGASAFSQVNNCPASLAPTKNCEVIFTFAPTALGTSTATWNLTGTGDSTFSYSPSLPGTLIGVAAVPGVTVSTGGHNFGTEFANYFTLPYGVVLTNSTTDTVNLLITNGNTNFKISQSTTNCTTTLKPNQSCNLQWEFAPSKGFAGAHNQPTAYSFLNSITATDAVTGKAVILTALGQQITGVQLTGFGISGPSNYLGVSTSVHNFGEWGKGYSSGLYGIQLINTSSSPMTVTYTEGSGFSNFVAPSSLNNCGFTPNGTPSSATTTLQPAASCQAQFYFLPNSATYGYLTASLGLTATVGGSPVSVEDLAQGDSVVTGITLAGEQVSGFLNLEFASHDFGGWVNGINSTVFNNQLSNTECATVGPGCPVAGNGIIITLKAGTGNANFPKAGTCTNGMELYPTGSSAGASSCTLNFHFDPPSGTLGELTELYGISGVDAVTGEPVQLTSGGAVVTGVSLAGYSSAYAGVLLTTSTNNFGEQGIGGTSAAYTTYLYNTYGATVTLANSYSNPSLGTNFTLLTPIVCTSGSTATSTSATIANHGYCTYQWTFNPTQAGPISVEYDMNATSGGTSLSITDVSTNQPVTGVTLQGTGVN